MAYKIQITRRASLDIDEVVTYIGGDSPTAARKWLEGLEASLETLSQMPLRHALIPEAEELERELRSILWHSHRVIYEVDEGQKTVSVVRVYHGARRPLVSRDLPGG